MFEKFKLHIMFQINFQVFILKRDVKDFLIEYTSKQVGFVSIQDPKTGLEQNFFLWG